MFRLLKPVALCLTLGMLLMLAAVTGTAFAHEIQHATHHNARMHVTGICAWMCTAAGSIATQLFEPLAYTVIKEFVPFRDTHAATIVFAQHLGARAPPVLL